MGLGGRTSPRVIWRMVLRITALHVSRCPILHATAQVQHLATYALAGYRSWTPSWQDGARLPAPGTFTRKTNTGVVYAAAAQGAGGLFGCSLWEGESAGRRGRWALGGCTRDGDRVGLSQLDGVQCCGLRLAACGLPELPAAEEAPQSSDDLVERKCTHTSQGWAAAWLNFLCIDVVELDFDALLAPATARLLYPIHRHSHRHRHRQSEALLDARTASAAQLAMLLLRSRRPHAAATTPTPASAHSGCVQIHREREEANAR